WSKAATRRITSDQRRLAPQLHGAGRVAAERGAVLLPVAVLAQRRGLGPEVLEPARPLDRRPDRRGPAAQPLHRLVRRDGRGAHRLPQVEQLLPSGPLAQDLIAQEGVEVDPRQAELLLGLARDAPRLVVGD